MNCSTWLTLAALLADVATQSVRLACVIWLFKFVPYSEGLSLLANVVLDTSVRTGGA